MSLLSSTRRTLGALGLVLAVAVAPLMTAPAVAAGPECDPLEQCDDLPAPDCTPDNLVPPTLSAQIHVWTALTVNPGTWTGDPTLTYQWLRGEVLIEGATSNRYTLQPEDAGEYIRARVVATNAACTPGTRSVETDPRGPIELTELQSHQPPSVVWTGRFEDAMSINPGRWNSLETPTFTYRWYRDTVASSPVGTAQEYQPTHADVGRTIIGHVHATSPGFVPAARTLDGVEIPQGEPPVRDGAGPAISGDPRVGSVLTVSDGGWSGAALWTVAYTWARDNVTIEGASSRTYTATADDVGRLISAEVSLTRPGHEPGTATAPAVRIGKGLAPVLAVNPVLKGTGRVGSVLTVTPGAWSDPAPTTVQLQWLRDGLPIPGATSSSLLLVERDRGRSIAVRVTGKRPGHESAVFTTSATTAALGTAPVAMIKPTVTGTRKFGKELTVNPGAWSTAATFSYQWYRGGAKVADATGMSYSLGAADIGKVIGVEVRALSTGHATGLANVTTGKIGHAGKLKYSSKSKVKIKGKKKVGKKLKVSVKKKTLRKRFGPDATKVTYQWYRGSKKIKRATKATYRVAKADRGKKVSVRVTGTRIGYLKGSVRSKAVKIAR